MLGGCVWCCIHLAWHGMQWFVHGVGVDVMYTCQAVSRMCEAKWAFFASSTPNNNCNHVRYIKP